MTESKICTCPSGDGSLRWPCPAHPAVEQAVGDERAAFEAAFAAMGRPVCRADYDQDAYGTPFDDGGWTGWQARAALAQPSPAQAEQHWPKLEKPAQVGGVRFSAGVSSRLVVEAAQRLYEFESTPEQEAERIERLQAFREQCFEPLGAEFSKVLSDNLPELLSTAQSEQAEAERPEVAEVAFVLRNIGAMDAEDIDGDNVDLRFEDAEGRDTGCDVSIVEYAEKAADLFEQHDRIVGTLRAENAKLSEALDECDGDRWKLRSERDSALARVAELERQEPVVRAYGVLPPFAEKVLAKLRRFYDCASDFESGGVDIGRHWLDLLTQLGLLNRVQRSPALWEISQQGEDLLGMPQPSPAQAEAERPEVVARVVHSNPVVLGQCGPLNANDELMTVAQHAASVARWAEMFNRVEQERDAALAEVERLRESKGDPVGSLEKCMKVMYERDEHAKRLEAALARVAELEKELAMARDAAAKGDAARHAAGGMEMEIQELREKVTELRKELRSRWTYASTQATNCAGCGEYKHTPLRVDWMGGYVCLTCIDKKLEELHDDQAQHSVPDGAADLCRFLAKLYCELDGLRYSTAKLPAEQIADALIFKWPVLQGARNQLNIKRISEQPYDESKLHSAIAAMLAAAPGKEVGHE
ncbi:hypothetical protein N0019_26680 [Pseudomonas aeruginosa]|nr:hypothetical protein [Pseudomonas aeruginosa]